MDTLVSTNKSCFIPFQNIEEIFAMKKRIVTLVALLMILCLALAGCGQRGSNTNDSSNHATSQNEENTTVNNTDMETEEPTETETETETNPSNSDFGMYTYELHGGITISCKTNVWDYIDGNTFNFRAMAHDLGWTIDYNDMPQCNMFSKDFGDDIAVSSGITAKYDYKGDNYPLVGIARGLPGGFVSEVFVYYYYDPDNTYTINGSGPTLSFDAIPIAAYVLENFTLENVDPVEDIFFNYMAPEEGKTASWRDYRLP